MNIKKRGLGKGLSDLGLGALLGDLKTPDVAIAPVDHFEEKNIAVDGELKKIPLHALVPGKYQPRKIITPEALTELADSIRTQGVIQPIVVRSIDHQRYEIIAGERRWRAAQLAELTYIPAIIRHVTDETAMVMALIENIQRRDLNVMEEANALNRLMNEFQLTHQAVADAVGKSRVAVTNILRLLKLHIRVRELIESGQLEMGHARALLTLDEEKQTVAAETIISRNLSVRETEVLIRNMMHASRDHSAGASEKTMLHTLQDRLTQKLGVNVAVTQNAKGRGKVVIAYQNEKELERVLGFFH